MKRISISIPDQLHRDLKTLAVYQDETLTSLVTRLIKAHLQVQDPSQPPSPPRYRSQPRTLSSGRG